MTKDEILYNVGLTEKVYSEPKDIDFKSLGIELIKWIEDKKSDTQGFVGIKNKSIYIVWRGSSSKKDFQNDASIDKVPFLMEGEKVHIGFKSSWESVKDQTYKALDKALKSLGGEDKIDNIIVCGHSLGGAVTTLFAYSIYTTYKSNKIISCTIGSPRVGNKIFKYNFDKSTIESLRIVNNLDVVTRTPNIGYHHVNTELRIDSEGKIKKWMVDWQRVVEYIKAVFTGKTAKDHKTSNYISALNKWNP